MSESWREFSPATSSRILHRGALRRLADLAEEGRRDRSRLYTFDQIFERVEPPAPEWLAWVLAEAVDHGLMETVVRVRCPCHKVGVGKDWSKPDDVPQRLICPFEARKFEVEPENLELLFRFRDPSDSSKLPPSNSSSRVKIPLLRRLLKTKFERIAETAGGQRRDRGTEAPNIELAGAILRSSESGASESGFGPASGTARRVGLTALAALPAVSVLFFTLIPDPTDLQARAYWIFLSLDVGVFAFCYPSAFLNAVLKLIGNLIIGILAASLIPLLRLILLPKLLPYLPLLSGN